MRGNRRGADILELLESARAEDPDEPFWRGVRNLTPSDDHVEVRWHDPVTPRSLHLDGVSVECHLYDEEALAERRAAGPSVPRKRRDRGRQAGPVASS